MQLTFLGNRYQRSEATTEVTSTEQKGMYRGVRYTVTRTSRQPVQNAQFCYRGIRYEH